MRVSLTCRRMLGVERIHESQPQVRGVAGEEAQPRELWFPDVQPASEGPRMRREEAAAVKDQIALGVANRVQLP